MQSELAWQRVAAAVQRRDAQAVAEAFTPDGQWRNVPHPPAVGRAEIAALLGPILARSERVEWDLVASVFEPRRAFLERVDRFWIDGVEYAVACNGVLEVDPTSGLITQWRDYVDLGEWRTRVGPALRA